MMHHAVLRGLCLVATLFVATVAGAADVPYLSGRVVDAAEILSPAVRERIADLSKAHEARTTNQVVVLTLRTLGGDSVEEFANRTFHEWKLGQSGKDNGVLVLVVPDERRMRIEVGYGLEGTLPDVVAARILRNRMTPKFKTGDYDGGVTDGVAAIIAELEGQSAPAGTAPATGAAKSLFESPALAQFDMQLPPWPMRILLGAFVFGVIGVFTVMGVVTPGMGWFLYVFLIPFWAMFPLMIVGVKGALALLSIYVVGFPIAKAIVRTRPWYEKAARDLKRSGRATLGGVVITSGSSSDSSSSGSSSGGFSGGGGSSGGGGASGSW